MEPVRKFGRAVDDPMWTIGILTPDKNGDSFVALKKQIVQQTKDRSVELLYLGGEGDPSAKREKLTKHATGKYLSFIKDDDKPLDNFVSAIIPHLDENFSVIRFGCRYTESGIETEDKQEDYFYVKTTGRDDGSFLDIDEILYECVVPPVEQPSEFLDKYMKDLEEASKERVKELNDPSSVIAVDPVIPEYVKQREEIRSKPAPPKPKPKVESVKVEPKPEEEVVVEPVAKVQEQKKPTPSVETKPKRIYTTSVMMAGKIIKQ